jgi:glycosyltransferase involved in cell wall biosynthesis
MSDFAVLPPKGTFRRKFNIPANRPMVLFMSRLNEKKGLDLLLPAFRDYVRQHPDTLLVLAGPDDGYEATARQFISQHQLDNAIQLVGMLTGDDKKAALHDADLFTLPSYSEGFSIAVLEAMAAGTPTLVSDRVGFGEAIRMHQAAGLVELNSESVQAGLAQLLGNPALRQQLSQNATNLLRTQYDMDIVARQMLRAYESAIQHRKANP